MPLRERNIAQQAYLVGLVQGPTYITLGVTQKLRKSAVILF